ncbi:MAG: hypothetical protein ABI091_30075 [Ferruginibacter sp.]
MLKLRRVTPYMLDILMDCHEREMMKHRPINYRTQYIKGLVERGYVKDTFAANEATGKKELAFVITNLGKDFLARRIKNA